MIWVCRRKLSTISGPFYLWIWVTGFAAKSWVTPDKIVKTWFEIDIECVAWVEHWQVNSEDLDVLRICLQQSGSVSLTQSVQPWSGTRRIQNHPQSGLLSSNCFHHFLQLLLQTWSINNVTNQTTAIFYQLHVWYYQWIILFLLWSIL